MDDALLKKIRLI